MGERLVVIGGDAAGMSAASQARRRRGAGDLEIVVFERGHHTSYSACGIPYLVADVVHDADDLVARRPEEFRSRFAMEVNLRHEVVAIDLDRRQVDIRDLETGRERSEGFDHLVVATGATPVRPRLPGVDAAGIYETEAVVVESTTRAGYFPGAALMKTKPIVERRSGRLLGAQIVGQENAGKRIDALAIALWNDMTVEEMTGLDLGYAPPYAPVWDPILIAARKATDKLAQ